MLPAFWTISKLILSSMLNPGTFAFVGASMSQLLMLRSVCPKSTRAAASHARLALPAVSANRTPAPRILGPPRAVIKMFLNLLFATELGHVVDTLLAVGHQQLRGRTPFLRLHPQATEAKVSVAVWAPICCTLGGNVLEGAELEADQTGGEGR